MRQASVSSICHGGGERRTAGMDVIAAPPLASAELAVDGLLGLRIPPNRVAAPAHESEHRTALAWPCWRENESKAAVESMRTTPL